MVVNGDFTPGWYVLKSATPELPTFEKDVSISSTGVVDQRKQQVKTISITILPFRWYDGCGIGDKLSAVSSSR